MDWVFPFVVGVLTGVACTLALSSYREWERTDRGLRR